MNIINIVNDNIDTNIDDTISVKNKNNNIDIIINNDTSFCIDLENNSINININITIKDNTSSKIFIMSKLENIILNINININQNCNALINHYTKNTNLEESVNVYLNKSNSNIEYNYSCLGSTKKTLNIYHNAQNTNSSVKTHGISNNEKQEFIIIENVPNGIINCNLSQSSKIINLGDNKSTIKPILLISEKEVNASHSSVISPINQDDLFYLMSRGINKNNSIELLTTGFLVNNLNLIEKEKHLLFDKYIFRR